ncbi:MAG: adenylate/guanylate cyclase domain-containing protein [Bacteroidota bacterium]
MNDTLSATFKFVLLFFCAFAANGSILLAQQPRSIGPDVQELNITDYSYLEDSTDSWTLNEVLAKSFLNYDGDASKLKESTNVYWVRFSIINEAPVDREWVFDFGSTIWGSVELYKLTTTNDWTRVGNSGRLQPVASRHYPVGQQAYFLQLLPGGERMDYLARLDANGVQSITYGPKVPELSLRERSLSDANDTNRKIWTAIFSAIFFFMFIYHLFVYYSARERHYLYYLGLVFTYFYLTLSNAGFLVSLLSGFEAFPQYQDSLAAFVSILTGIFTIQFTRVLLDTKRHLPFWDKVLKFLILFLIVQIFGQLLLKPLFLAIAPLSILFQYLSLIIVGVLSFGRKIPSGGLYFLAYSFSILGVIYFVLSMLKLVPFPEFGVLYGPPLGWALEILFFSFAIINIINVLKQKSEDSQNRYIAQLKENEKLQTKVNQELEAKVQERTVELQHQHDLLKLEKDKSDNLLLNILPVATANELKTTGKATPKSYDQVAVLFTDFKDFSLIAESMSADELVDQLDRCFKAFDDLVVSFGLEKIKTIGDSYMCAGGLDEQDPEAVLKTVKLALGIKKFMDNWNQQRLAAGEKPWEIRIGIHTGSLTAGVVGKKKFAFDIWGDTVNIASRMESTCEPGKINVSKDTWELINKQFEGTYRGKIKAKNKGEIEMFYVERLLAVN